MADQLSMFEGREVVANAHAFGGTLKDPVVQPLGESKLGERRVLLVVTRTDEVKFSDGDLGRVRHHKEVISEAYDISELGVDGDEMVDELRALNERVLAERMAETPTADYLGEANGNGEATWAPTMGAVGA